MATSLFALGRARLLPLCEAMGFAGRSDEIEGVFRDLLDPWGLRAGSLAPSWPSDVGDDHTPFEFSIALLDRPELRLLVEPLHADAPSLRGNAQAARELLQRLAARHALSLERIDEVWDLFVPPEPRGRFSVWIGAVFSATREPAFKIYFNPEAQGWIPMLAPAVIEEALDRLGMPTLWTLIGRTLGRRGRFLDEFKYISFDLSSTPGARVKIYARHRAASLAELQAVVQGVSWYRPADLTEFIERVAPTATRGAVPRFERRGIQTCFSFVEGDPEPTQVTTHFPINSYADNDAIVRDRVLACLSHFGLPSDAYERAIEAFRNRPLAAGIGMHSYASLCCQRTGARRLTIYLPAEAYQPGRVAQLGPSSVPRDGDEIVFAYEHRRPITVHPFLSLMWRRAVDPGAPMIDLLERVQRAFAAVSGALAGDPAPEPGRAATPGITSHLDELVSGVRRLGADETLGMALVLGLYHRQINSFVRDLPQLRSPAPWPDPVDGAVLADLVRKVARARTEDLIAVWRGTERAANALDACLDDLYGACVSPPSSPVDLVHGDAATDDAPEPRGHGLGNR